jgi:DNA-binding LacI/PurR family transcriptional regulator
VGTVRKGIQELVNEGYLVKRWGKGTFVSYTGKKSVIREKIALIMPFFDIVDSADIVAGVESVLTDAGYDLVLYSTDYSPQKERELLEMSLGNGIKGLLLFPSRKYWTAEALSIFSLSECPVVLLDRKISGFKFDSVVYDNVQAGYLGTKYLISQGYRNIAFLVNFSGILSVQDRVEGYKKALREAGLPIREEYIVEEENERKEDMEKILRKLMDFDVYPNAILAVNEGMCLDLLRLFDNGSKFASSVKKIVGIGNTRPWDQFSVPVTTIDLPTFELGSTAARLLLERIAQSSGLVRDVVLPVSLVVRD